jgi:predicted ATPase/DNA-binding SARP family transcriptional activator/tetratricopeptide (TPR) repeat protein
MANAIEISLLGPFQIRRAGASAVTFEADTARGLFAFLLQHSGRSIRRENLAALLWPDQDDQTALHNLRNALSRVRKSIADQAADPPFLTIDRKSIGINPDSDLKLDTADFEAQVSFVQSHSHPRLAGCPICLEKLFAAAEIYRGDFLAGFSLPTPLFQEWQQNEISRYGRSAMFVFDALAQNLLEDQQFTQAAQVAARQLDLHPWEERAHRQLMTAYALDGNRSAALAQFESCKQILTAELAADPEPVTERLAKAIRTGDLARLTKSTPPTNQVAQPEALIGRGREQADLTTRLLEPDERLITLLGPGGMGKTRLAEAVVWQLRRAFPDGAYLMSLTQLDNPAPDAIALSLAVGLGIRLEGREPAALELVRVLENRHALLVLDNLEQLISSESGGGVDFVLQLLNGCPRLTLLITSRVRLGLNQEYAFRLDGLEISAADRLSNSARLFVNEADRTPGGFEVNRENEAAVDTICELVAGLPLAIKLAAAWTDRLTPAEIAAELTRNLELLATQAPDIPERHRSIRAVFDGSWLKLTDSQQLALIQLTVFQGGFSREMAAKVTHVSRDDLFELANQSFLVRSRSGRFTFHELIRQLAGQKLAEQADLQTDTRARHSLELSDWVGQQIGGLRGPDQIAVRKAIDLDFANVRTAWYWAVDQGQTDSLARALGGLTTFLLRQNRILEGVELLRWAHERCAGQLPARLQARIEVHLATFLRSIGHYDESRQLLDAGLTALKAIQADPSALCLAYNSLNLTASRMGDLKPAKSFAEAALEAAQASHDDWLIAFSLHNLADLHEGLENYALAIDYLAESLAISESLGDLQRLALGYNLMGILLEMQQDFPAADARYQEALALALQLGDRWIQGFVYGNLGDLALARGDYLASRQHLQASLRIATETQASGYALMNVYKFAELAAAEGQPASAMALAQFVLGHSAADAFFKQRAESLLASLPTDLQAAQLPGRLEHVVQSLLH